MQLAGKRGRAAGAGEKDNFRPDIEGLRGIAVLLVVLYHAGTLSNSSLQIPGGFVGVDLFFVISGFLITGLLIRERERTGKVSFSRFYARRVRRILPAAAVVLLVTLVIAYQLVALSSRSAVMEDGASSAVSIANIRFAMTTDYFNPTNNSFSPFLHFWSLGVEEQFYFIWPALLALVAWRKPRLGAAVALSVVAVVSFAASVIVTQSSPATAFYLLPTRAWQLAAGGLLAIGVGSLARTPQLLRAAVGQFLSVAGWVALAALAWIALTLDSKTVPYPGTAALLPTLAGVVLIAAGAEQAGPGAFLRLMPVRFLGKISYSLYLWHWPILILGGLYLGGPLDQALTPLQALALAGFSIPVATVSWGLVEEPFRRGQIPLPRPSRVVAAGVTVMLAVALLGASFDWNAQTALANVGNEPGVAAAEPTPTPTAAVARPTATPTVTPVPLTLAPNATPSPILGMTPALPTNGGPETANVALNNATRPTLANAPNDNEPTWLNNCLGWDATTVPSTSNKCVYGDPTGTFTVALVGDSHASALFPAVEAVAIAHGWRLVEYLKISCQFIDMRITDPNLNREYTECATWNQNVVARLRANPPDLVLVSGSRWIYAVNPGEANATYEGNALARMIKQIPSSSRVAIIEDPPLPSLDVPKCLSSYPTDVLKCAYSRAVGFGSAMGVRETTASKVTGAPVIALTDQICPGTGACPVVIDNMIAWRDPHHLTATFSRSLGPALDAKIVAILTGQAAPGPSTSVAP
ncbi:MAG TPA: acyltransferase family protein [Candidatus Limnocylindrales bacterium]